MAAIADLIRYQNAQHFLRALRTVKVGTMTGGEALEIAKRFNPKAYVLKHTELPSGFSDGFVDVPVTDCLSGNCSLSFDADASARWMEAISYPYVAVGRPSQVGSAQWNFCSNYSRARNRN
jgi:hypothetical protein